MMDEYIKKLEDTNKLLEQKLFLYSYKFGEIDIEEVEKEFFKDNEKTTWEKESDFWVPLSTTVNQSMNVTQWGGANAFVKGDTISIKDHSTFSFDTNLPFATSKELESARILIQNEIYKTRPKQSKFIRIPRIFFKKLKRKIYEKTRISRKATPAS